MSHCHHLTNLRHKYIDLMKTLLILDKPCTLLFITDNFPCFPDPDNDKISSSLKGALELFSYHIIVHIVITYITVSNKTTDP